MRFFKFQDVLKHDTFLIFKTRALWVPRDTSNSILLRGLSIPLPAPLSANSSKWSNTRKQFVDSLPTKFLSVFNHFVELASEGLTLMIFALNSCQNWLILSYINFFQFNTYYLYYQYIIFYQKGLNSYIWFG